jgi:hypothetical protein
MSTKEQRLAARRKRLEKFIEALQALKDDELEDAADALYTEGISRGKDTYWMG